jgi:hypothetical protein
MNCNICNTIFIPKTSNQKTCSVLCQKKYLIEYKKQHQYVTNEEQKKKTQNNISKNKKI